MKDENAMQNIAEGKENESESEKFLKEAGTSENYIKQIGTESEEFLRQAGVLNRISFRDGREHIMEIKKDEIAEIETREGKKRGIKYTVTEENEKKEFFTTSIKLIIEILKLLKANKRKQKIQLKNMVTAKGIKSYYTVHEAK